MVEAKTAKSKEILPILTTENKNTQPVLGLDRLDKLDIGLQGSKKINVIRHIDADERRERIVNEYKVLFRNYHTIKDLILDIQLKKDSKPIQKRADQYAFTFKKFTKPPKTVLCHPSYYNKEGQIGQNSIGSEKTE